jgi:hypothetical protein
MARGQTDGPRSGHDPLAHGLIPRTAPRIRAYADLTSLKKPL